MKSHARRGLPYLHLMVNRVFARWAVILLLWAGGIESARAQSSVWRARLGDEVVYLGGTCHMLRAIDFPLPAEFESAYAQSDSLFFETEMERMKSAEVQGMLLGLGVLVDGSTLKDHLSPTTWAAVEAHCAANDLPVEVFMRMKPWMFAVTIAVLEWQKQGAVQDGVDATFHERAMQDGKVSRGLEKIEAHLQFITTIGEGQEDEMIMSTLQDLESMTDEVSELIAAWRTGDIETLDREMMADMRENFETVYQKLVVGRNHAWIPQIMAMFKTPETEFVLVGVGHFGGTDGVLELLRKKGVVLERVLVAPEN